MKNKIKLFALLTLVSLFAGCVSWGGWSNRGFVSNVDLKQPGYKIIDRISGTAKVMYLFGSIPFGDAELYKRAMEELRQKASLDNKSRALANVTIDFNQRNFWVIKYDELTITADVVEFQKVEK